MTRPVLAILAVFGLTGCYLSHERPNGDGGARSDASLLDAEVVDAEPVDADPVDANPGDADPIDARPDAFVLRDGSPPDDACTGPSCQVAEVLNGLRWELPCSNPQDRICDTEDEVLDSVVAGGEAGARYAVSLRFRGVVETASYEGGAAMGHFVIGGRHYGGAWNLYALEVTSPRQTYFLNNGPEGDYHTVAIDYVQEIELEAGSGIRLIADSVEGRQIQNLDPDGAPIVVPEIVPFPAPFDGQFIQVDVVSVRRVR